MTEQESKQVFELGGRHRSNKYEHIESRPAYGPGGRRPQYGHSLRSRTAPTLQRHPKWRDSGGLDQTEASKWQRRPDSRDTKG